MSDEITAEERETIAVLRLLLADPLEDWAGDAGVVNIAANSSKWSTAGLRALADALRNDDAPPEIQRKIGLLLLTRVSEEIGPYDDT